MSNRPNRKPSSSVRITQARTTDRGRTVWIVAVVAIAFIAALVIAIVAARGSGQPAATVSIPGGGTTIPVAVLTTGDIRVTGNALAEMPATPGQKDPAVGMPAPSISGEQFDGRPLTIPGAGKPKVIVFLAHWCPHCQKEVPLLAGSFAEIGLPSGVDLYAVATATNETRPNYPPGDWLRREAWPVPTIADDAAGTAAKAYGLAGYPYYVAVDASGNVVSRSSGELTIEQFQALVEAARTGSPTGSPAVSAPPR